jgi:hypothetical protein
VSFRFGSGVAVFGALIVHPLLFFVAFLCGACFGASRLDLFLADNLPTEYGLNGASNACERALIIYLWSIGIVPLIVSAIGAGLALGVGKDFRRKDHPPPTKITK